MADFASLKAKIITKLQTLEVDSEVVFDTDGVYGREPKLDDIVQDPVVTVTASDNESDFINTSENRRIYAYVLRIYIERNQDAQTAEDNLTEIVDAVIDAFDQDYTLTGEALLVEAAPSLWAYSQGVKEWRVAEIRIRAKVDFDTSA